MGGFTGILNDFNGFGSSVARVGDLDGDGVTELAVGAPEDGEAGLSFGAVWILFLNREGTVKRHVKYSPAPDDMQTDQFGADFNFGRGLAELGDIDGDGIPDLGVITDDQVWVLLLNSDGSTKAVNRNDAISGQTLTNNGRALGGIADLNGDGTADLLYCNSSLNGFLRLHNLKPDGTVYLRRILIDDRDWPELPQQVNFGYAVSSVGDLDGNGVGDVAIGARRDGEGSVWIAFLDSTRSSFGGILLEVSSLVPINAVDAGIIQPADESDFFGSALADVGDLDGDGVPDLIVGASSDDEGGSDRGALYVLFLNPDGTLRTFDKISSADGTFSGALSDGDAFGAAVANLGDINNDGVIDLAIGAPGDGPGDKGAVWIYFGLKTLPPGVLDVQHSPEHPTPGQNVYITATMPAVSGVTSALLAFKRGGDDDEDDVLFDPMTLVAPNTYRGRIHNAFVEERGVEYFISSTAGGPQNRYPSEGFVAVSVYVPEGLDHRPPVSGREADFYRLFSVPLDLDEKDSDAVLVDDLGPNDGTAWRLFELPAGTTYVESSQTDLLLEPGRAFWLLVAEEGQIINTGPGNSVLTDSPFEIDLRTGWTLVGNPFAFPVPLENLRTQSGTGIDIRTYEGAWSEMTEPLEPFAGYAVHNDTGDRDVLFIEPNGAGDPAGQLAEKTTGLGWAVKLRAQLGRARDVDTEFVVAEGARVGWDHFDRPEPPLIGEFVSVYVPHPDWGRTTSAYTKDVRPIPTDGETWSFIVKTRQPGAVALHFEDLDSVPSDLQVWLLDRELRLSQNLRMNSAYSVASSGARRPKSLELIVGSEAFVESKIGQTETPRADLTLHQNFPNPFDRVTSIRFDLPESSVVTLEIFSLLGDRVAILLRDEKQEAGSHVVVWDGSTDFGRKLAIGPYFYRLLASDREAFGRMLLAR